MDFLGRYPGVLLDEETLQFFRMNDVPDISLPAEQFSRQDIVQAVFSGVRYGIVGGEDKRRIPDQRPQYIKEEAGPVKMNDIVFFPFQVESTSDCQAQASRLDERQIAEIQDMIAEPPVDVMPETLIDILVCLPRRKEAGLLLFPQISGLKKDLFARARSGNDGVKIDLQAMR